MSSDERVSHDLGEVKGLLQGIKDMMALHNTTMHQRIDDMHKSNTQRLDDLNLSINTRFSDHQSQIAEVKSIATEAKDMALKNSERIDAINGRVGKTSAASGAGTGLIVTVAFEFLKAMFLPSP